VLRRPGLPVTGQGSARIRVAACSLAFLLLAGCGGNVRAPVEDRNRSGSLASHSSGYAVQRGDTLYSIAFRYGLDYRRLAAANRIAYPYTIYPGQRLQLAEAEVPPSAPARPAGTSASRPASNPPRNSPGITPPPTVSPAVIEPSSKPATSSGSVARAAVPVPEYGPVSSWRWPTSGKVIRGYSSSVHKGIDIGGRRGDAVVAVAAGRVVYAGTGIVGLGELIIVKHNEIYLSAYGHNNRLLVSEGDLVRAGQKIAEKGSSGTDTVRLHFEVRKEGKPIDPEGLLSRR